MYVVCECVVFHLSFVIGDCVVVGSVEYVL